MSASRILAVDDEPTLLEAVGMALEAAGYTVSKAASAEQAFMLLPSVLPELVVLDISLPGNSGLDLLRQMRAAADGTPVLLLTALDSPEDRVRGLDAGADDYLGKPFAMAELVARVRALLRRSMPVPASAPKVIAVGDLELFIETRTVLRGGAALDLTAREFDLLVYMAGQEGRVVSREMLAHHVWHETARFTPINNVIDVQIARLRRKLDEPFATRLLHTIRGVGFALRPESAA